MAKVKINNDDEAIFIINGKEINVSKKSISPTDAHNIIEHSDSIFTNRKSRENSYKIYQDDMNSGHWKTNGETIKFSSDGALIDGRNRLSAVEIGNKTIDFLSIGNLDRDVVDTIDIGLKRTLEHVLQMQEREYQNGAATIVKFKITLDKGLTAQEGAESTLGISRLSEVEEYKKNISAYNSISAFAKDIYNLSHKALSKQYTGGIYAHLLLTQHVDEEVIKEFFNKLASPAKDTFFFKSYDRLSNKKNCRGKDKLHEYILCWNSFMRGCRTRRSQYTDGDWFLTSSEH